MKFEGIYLPEGQKMKTLEDDGYKDLGVPEYNDLLHERMKGAMRSKYYRRMKKVLKSKLNGRNIILAMNTWAMSVLWYGARIINWTKAQLENMDRQGNGRRSMECSTLGRMWTACTFRDDAVVVG